MRHLAGLITALALIICWDPNTESDLLGYWVVSAERHIIDWVECPCEPGVPCLITLCPIYSDLRWQHSFTGYATTFRRDDCAHELGSLCVFKYPRAEDWSGNISPEVDITPTTITWGATCPG